MVLYNIDQCQPDVFKKGKRRVKIDPSKCRTFPFFGNLKCESCGSEIIPACARSKLLGDLKKRIDEDAMPRDRRSVLGRALYGCKSGIHELCKAVEMLLPYVHSRTGHTIETYR